MVLDFPRFPFEPEPTILEDGPSHRRYYQIAGITVQVESDIPITDATFAPKFKHFQVAGPGDDAIRIQHHFSLPRLPQDLGVQVYQKSPWTIFRKEDSWIYIGTSAIVKDSDPYQVTVFNEDHTDARIYNDATCEKMYRRGGMTSLTLFPTDQILLARALVDRQACYIHSGAVVLNGRGLVFVGHSEAGKSTMVKFLQEKTKILCDDRNIIRRHLGQFSVHGSWSHGEVSDVSADSAPLSAIFFLHKSNKTRIVPQRDQSVIVSNLLACLIRPLITADWWNRALTLVDAIARDTPCYDLEFDKSGDVVHLLEDAELS